MFTQKAPALAMRGQLVELRAGAEDHHRGIERERGEGLAGEADRDTVLERGDDGDTGREVAEYLAEPGLIEARHGYPSYALPRSTDWASWADDTSSINLASGSRRRLIEDPVEFPVCVRGSWCDSSRRCAPASAATCTA